MEEQNKKILEIQVAGKDLDLWKKLKDKLMDKIPILLNNIIDQDQNSMVRDGAKEFFSVFLDPEKRKFSLDNEKIFLEIENSYKSRAEFRKLNAEASAIELQNNIKALKISLGALKVLMIMEQGEEIIIFLKQIDPFLALLERLDHST